MQYHAVADLFPMMNDDEYQALVGDMRAYGQREPIWTLDDAIIDGRNRWRACQEIGIAPVTRTYQGDSSMGALVQFVLSLNLKRRHLTSSQKAVIALEVERLLAEEAKERQRSLAGTRPNTSPNLPELIPEGLEGKATSPPVVRGEAREQAAAITGTNGRYISDAKRLAAEAPELLAKVRAGEMTIPQAKQAKKQQERIQKIEETEAANESAPIEQRRYRVIYADPPWKYGNTMPEYFDEQAHHYPLMTVNEICEMPIDEIAMDDAVLFLWVTSPILAESFDVIRAWGFKYKSSFVWDKIKHNMGHYNSVRHELLLVCTRGSCTPDKKQLFDSVQSIERTRHSEKPAVFREIIDTIYPRGPRIELFARTSAEGWDTYGNEVAASIALP